VFNKTSQATPVFAFLLAQRQVPGAPGFIGWSADIR
jgi:hypothetical protein